MKKAGIFIICILSATLVNAHTFDIKFNVGIDDDEGYYSIPYNDQYFPDGTYLTFPKSYGFEYFHPCGYSISYTKESNKTGSSGLGLFNYYDTTFSGSYDGEISCHFLTIYKNIDLSGNNDRIVASFGPKIGLGSGKVNLRCSNYDKYVTGGSWLFSSEESSTDKFSFVSLGLDSRLNLRLWRIILAPGLCLGTRIPYNVSRSFTFTPLPDDDIAPDFKTGLYYNMNLGISIRLYKSN